MRDSTRRVLIRSLLDIHLSRPALAVLACVSVLATVLIIAGGGQRTPAQVAALAALHERPKVVVQAAGSGATAPPAPIATASTVAGSDEGGSDGSGFTPAPASSTPASSSDDGSADDSSTATDDSTTTSSTTSTTGTSTTAPANTDLPKVGHLFVIALSTTSYTDAWSKGSQAPYLRSLKAKGTLLSGYGALGKGELADYLAMVSGQPPDADTAGGCTTFKEFPSNTTAKSDGLVPGDGCVYPETALTIGDQVSASGHEWKAYIDGLGSQTCVHPNSDAVDDVALPGTDAGYDTRHNPFIYFHSLLDLGDCATDDQDLTKLAPALDKASRTATFSFIAPGGCDDAAAVAGEAMPGEEATTTPATTTTSSTSTTSTTSTSTSTSTSTATSTTSTGTTTAPATATPTSTTCPAGQPAGIAAENAFLAQWVPKILGSAAYRHNGVLVIAFAHTGAASGGDKKTGALVLSRFAHRGKVVAGTYGPYSLLRSVEDMLGYDPLADAKPAKSFAAAVLHK